MFDRIGLAYPWSENTLLAMSMGRLNRLHAFAEIHLARLYGRA